MKQKDGNISDTESLTPGSSVGESSVLDLLIRNDGKLENEVQLKLGIISPVIFGTYIETSAKAYLRKAADKQYTLPDGTIVKFGLSTLERWVHDYRKKGVEALVPKERSDRGTFRKLPIEVRSEIINMVTKCPDIKCTKIRSRLEKANLIQAGELSTDTINRFIKAHDLRTIVEEDEVERIRHLFIEAETGYLWAADTMYLCKIEVDGKLKWVYLQGIIDDHSRMIVSARCYLSDSAINFQDTLFLAIQNFGIPVKLYVDNGSAYIDGDLKRICSILGITIIHTRSHDGRSKGVVERFWLSSYYEVNADIILDDATELEQIQAIVDEWIEKYNHRVNRGVNGIPRERYVASAKRHPMRYPDSEEALKEAFLHIKTRAVRCGAVQQDNVFYELPDALRTAGTPKKIQIYFNPRDVENTIFTTDQNGNKHALHKLDKEANAGKKRNTGGRTTEVREKAAQKAAKQMTKSEEHAEKRYQRTQAAIRRANARNAGANVPSEAGDSQALIELDYTAV